jgi:hypothetical protein
MLRKNKNKLNTQPDIRSEQEVFNIVTEQVLTKANIFVSKTDIHELDILTENDMKKHLYDTPEKFPIISPEHAGALVEAIYIGYGAENPNNNPAKWEQSDSQYKAVTSTEFGFNIVESRYQAEGMDARSVDSPLDCRAYKIKFVRP